MPKPEAKKPVGAPEQDKMPLDEFCRRLSETDKRVSLIAGFYADAKASGNRADTLAAFKAKFAAYATRPIN